MAIFPKIEKHCPLKSDYKAYLDGDTCRMCQRVVHDLSAMGETDRADFLSSCETEVCVSYSIPKPRTIGAALAAAALLGTPIAAHATDPGPAPTTEQTTTQNTVTDDDLLDYEDDWIIVGGIKDIFKAEYVDTEADLEIPEMPVVYEDDAPETEAKPESDTEAETETG